VPMDGGHKSVAVGLCGYRGLNAHHTPDAIRKSDSYMDPAKSGLHASIERQGRMVNEKVNVFTIETALNNRMYGPALDFLAKPEEDWTALDRSKFNTAKFALEKMPRPMKRAIMHATPAPYEVIGVHAGRTEAVHSKTLEHCWRQYIVPLDGQSDVVLYGVPFVSPYNCNSILNPLLVQVMVQGYFHNMYRGKPVVKKGGTVIFTHPCYDEFHAGHHPSYIEFFNRLLPETRDAKKLQHKYEAEFAKNPNYVQMYRRGNAYHGAHPFYMWYWGENGRQHAGRVIAVGAESPHVPERMGWEWAPDLETALDMARDTHGHGMSVTYMKVPPIFVAEVS
jgi:hypothetical protein